MLKLRCSQNTSEPHSDTALLERAFDSLKKASVFSQQNAQAIFAIESLLNITLALEKAQTANILDQETFDLIVDKHQPELLVNLFIQVNGLGVLTSEAKRYLTQVYVESPIKCRLIQFMSRELNHDHSIGLKSEVIAKIAQHPDCNALDEAFSILRDDLRIAKCFISLVNAPDPLLAARSIMVLIENRILQIRDLNIVLSAVNLAEVMEATNILMERNLSGLRYLKMLLRVSDPVLLAQAMIEILDYGVTEKAYFDLIANSSHPEFLMDSAFKLLMSGIEKVEYLYFVDVSRKQKVRMTDAIIALHAINQLRVETVSSLLMKPEMIEYLALFINPDPKVLLHERVCIEHDHPAAPAFLTWLAQNMPASEREQIISGRLAEVLTQHPAEALLDITRPLGTIDEGTIEEELPSAAPAAVINSMSPDSVMMESPRLFIPSRVSQTENDTQASSKSSCLQRSQSFTASRS